MGDWWTEALCAGPDVAPDWWSVETVLSEGNRKAMRICGGCPVAQECWRDNYGRAQNVIIAGWWITNKGRISQQAGQPAPAGPVLAGSRP